MNSNNSNNSNNMYFILDGNYQEKIDTFPFGITHLKVNNGYSYPLDNLPSSITHLDLGDYSQKIDIWPSELTHLTLPVCYYDGGIVDNLPNSIKYLDISGDEYQFENLILPSSLEYLSLPIFAIEQINIPPTLMVLNLNGIKINLKPDINLKYSVKKNQNF